MLSSVAMRVLTYLPGLGAVMGFKNLRTGSLLYQAQ